MQLDRRLSFGEHLQIATAKAIQCGAALTRLKLNISGPVSADGSPGRTDDGRVVRDFKLEPTAREV